MHIYSLKTGLRVFYIGAQRVRHIGNARVHDIDVLHVFHYKNVTKTPQILKKVGLAEYSFKYSQSFAPCIVKLREVSH